jgi:DNA-binding winged helix-turn-helix (wHTH) protein
MRHERYTFGDAALDVEERRVTRGGQPVQLAPKAHDVLVHLVRRAGHLVQKQELLQAVWPEAFVEEGILAVHISGLRSALRDNPRAPWCIETVAKSGYRVIAPVQEDNSASIAPAPVRAEVHELVGRARAHLMSASRAAVPQAVRLFQEAIDLDPTHAPAHAGLALACCAEADWRISRPVDAYARARTAALRALAMDDASADASVALGAVMFLGEWDWIGAERSLQRALEINPDHVQGRLLYGHLLDTQGKLQDGLAMRLRALETAPFSPAVHLALALSYWNQRRYGEAIRWANKTLELDAAHGLAREFLAGAYWKLGDFDRHMAENVKHAAAHGVPAEALDGLRRAYANSGRAGVLTLALEQADRLPDLQLALFHGELGDLDRALTHLERAIQGRDPCLVDLAVSPQWDVLRADPRFSQCVKGMGLASRSQVSTSDGPRREPIISDTEEP